MFGGHLFGGRTRNLTTEAEGSTLRTVKIECLTSYSCAMYGNAARVQNSPLVTFEAADSVDFIGDLCNNIDNFYAPHGELVSSPQTPRVDLDGSSGPGRCLRPAPRV
ncbi:MAG: hypothetical protein AAF725_11025 [Acidobacteriota bacterium]